MAVVIHGTRVNNTDLMTPDFPGAIIQVVQGIKTDTFSTSANLQTKATVTGLSASITPTSATNKILVVLSLMGGGDRDTTFGGTILRDTTAIGIADASSNRTRNTFGQGIIADSNGVAQARDWVTGNISCSVLDSPATTSATTYSVKIGGNGTATVTVNFDERNTDSATDTNIASSSITLYEVVAS